MNNLFAKILRKKHINHKHPADLKKCLSALDLTLLGIGCIIGTGIFVLTGIAAANQAGPAVILSFIVSGFACAFAALAYAELSSSIGGCGSAYGYSYVAFGEFFAWIIGWILLMEYGMSIAAVANGWSGHLQSINMNKNQAEKALGLVNVAIDTIQKIAEQEREIVGAKHRDIRYVQTILKLQEKKRSVENFLSKAGSNG